MTFGDLLCFGKIVRKNWFTAKQRLEYVRNFELSSNGVPFRILPGHLGDVNSVVDETELIVGRFVLEIVAILLTEVEHEIDDLRVCVRDLDRVGLDVDN